jgi:LmbE family N-acetylglucosaminyl deacetylase
MKALCMVAHPDDCVIFAYSYIYNHAEYNWTIGYLTYTKLDPRGAEIAEFWRKRSVDCVFLGFEDHWHDNEQGQFTRWSAVAAESACWTLAADYDLILTHDEHGDYGHIHHQLVHRAVVQHHRVITFASPGKGTTYTIPAGTYSLDELPLHREVVACFHSAGHQNSYSETR